MTTSDLFLISHNIGGLWPILLCKKKKVLCIFRTSTFIVTKMQKLAPPQKRQGTFKPLFLFLFLLKKTIG